MHCHHLIRNAPADSGYTTDSRDTTMANLQPVTRARHRHRRWMRYTD
jgi:hypothetical protein